MITMNVKLYPRTEGYSAFTSFRDRSRTTHLCCFSS